MFLFTKETLKCSRIVEENKKLKKKISLQVHHQETGKGREAEQKSQEEGAHHSVWDREGTRTVN